ncbi:hypothetical protein NUBL10708_13440 [Klebsiella pneumoniae]|nr:hypothetical protein NUBL10698_22680 [Klebsiella pneumoniae]GKK75455.1 hypothetical protein NUBL10708_13440 [Klebsiella pneumoniae]
MFTDGRVTIRVALAAIVVSITLFYTPSRLPRLTALVWSQNIANKGLLWHCRL